MQLGTPEMKDSRDILDFGGWRQFSERWGLVEGMTKRVGGGDYE